MQSGEPTGQGLTLQALRGSCLSAKLYRPEGINLQVAEFECRASVFLLFELLQCLFGMSKFFQDWGQVDIRIFRLL
jgi:hypothetical protein